MKKQDIVEFGSYYQINGKEKTPIEWRVLDIKDGEALLLSLKILDWHNFDSNTNDWENSEIREWLNDYFYNEAFSKEEKKKIIKKTLETEEDFCDDPKSIKETNDNVFLLTMYDVHNNNYGNFLSNYTYHYARRKRPTEYAISRGVIVSKSKECKGNGYWWLRTPSGSRGVKTNDHVYVVGYMGGANVYQHVDTNGYGVVPAIWIKVDENSKE